MMLAILQIGIYGYIADVTKLRSRTSRVAFVDLFLFFAMPCGIFLSDYIFRAGGNFHQISFLICTLKLNCFWSFNIFMVCSNGTAFWNIGLIFAVNLTTGGFLTIFGIGFLLDCLALLYTIFCIKETRERDVNDVPEARVRLFAIGNVTSVFRTVFKRRENGLRTVLLLLLLAMMLNVSGYSKYTLKTINVNF